MQYIVYFITEQELFDEANRKLIVMLYNASNK